MMTTKKTVKLVVMITMMMMMMVMMVVIAKAANDVRETTSEKLLKMNLLKETRTPSMEFVLFNPPRRKEASQAGVQIQSSVSHKSEELSNLSTWNTKESSSSSSLPFPTSSPISSLSSPYPSSPSVIEQLGITSISRDLFQHSSQLSYERMSEVDNTHTSSLPLSSSPPSFISLLLPSSTFSSSSSSSSSLITKPSIFQSSLKLLPQNTLVSPPAVQTISSSPSSSSSSSSSSSLSSSQIKKTAGSLSWPILSTTNNPRNGITPSTSSSPALVIFSPKVIQTLITSAVIVHSSVASSPSSSSPTIRSLLSSPSPLSISPSPSSKSSLKTSLSPITKSLHSLSIYSASLTSLSLILSPPSSSPPPPSLSPPPPSSSQPPPSLSPPPSPSSPPSPTSSSPPSKSHPSSSLRPSIQCAGHTQLFNFLVSTVKTICLTTDMLGDCVYVIPVALNRSEKPEECNVCLCVQITRTLLRLSCENENRCQDLIGNSRDRMSCFNITLRTSCMAGMTADESSIKMNEWLKNESRPQAKKKPSSESNSVVKRSLKDSKSTFHEDIPVKIHEKHEKEVMKNNATKSASHTTNDSQLHYVLQGSAPNNSNDLNVVTLVLSPEESRKSKLRKLEMMRLHKDWKESADSGFRDSTWYNTWYNSPTVIAVLTSLGASLFLVVACIFGFVVADLINTNRRRFLRSKVSPLLESSELLP